ncbi:MAG: hypothetical protein ACOH5I_09370 [Oligoflexus sp.]
MIKRPRVFMYVLLVFSLYGCGQNTNSPSPLKEAPNSFNDPVILGLQTKAYHQIRMQAQATSKATWSGSYWPNGKLGIANRWQDGMGFVNPNTFAAPQIDQVMRMSPEQRNRLSPAEKYDLIIGRADFPVTNYEINLSRQFWNYHGGSIPEWFGICDGWAIASMMTVEPRQSIRVPTPFEFTVDIYPADLKAMLSFFFAKTAIYARIVGGRCNQQTVMTDSNGRPSSSECRDLNPATLHLALDDIIGRQNRPLILDTNPGHEVWNAPVTAYRMGYQNFRPWYPDGTYPHAAAGTSYLVDVAVEFQHTAGSFPQYQPEGNLSNFSAIYYTLELDAEQRIIGGEWSSSDHPDFLWDLIRYDPVSSSVPVMNFETLSYLLQYAR